jgi:hypothetical protein
MAKKMKRFNAGGTSDYEGDDPIVKYRMGMIDAKGNDLTKKSEPEFETKTGENEAISKIPGLREKAMKSVEKLDEKSDEVKKEVKPKAVTTARKVVAKTDTKASMNDMPESLRAPDYKAPSMAKAVSKEVTKPTTKPTSKFDPAAAAGVRRPAPAPEFMTKAMGYKSGGGVKSASARADGCAIRGKTRA